MTEEINKYNLRHIKTAKTVLIDFYQTFCIRDIVNMINEMTKTMANAYILGVDQDKTIKIMIPKDANLVTSIKNKIYDLYIQNVNKNESYIRNKIVEQDPVEWSTVLQIVLENPTLFFKELLYDLPGMYYCYSVSFG
jgi:hypothetical protein